MPCACPFRGEFRQFGQPQGIATTDISVKTEFLKPQILYLIPISSLILSGQMKSLRAKMLLIDNNFAVLAINGHYAAAFFISFKII